MWKLKSGNKVEKVMEKLALACNYEHPCHSLILDLGHPVWKEYFSIDELKEIREYRKKTLEVLPAELTEYLGSFRSLSNAKKAYYHAFKDIFDPVQQPACAWTQFTIIQAARLLSQRDDLDFSKFTEADILCRVWGFLVSLFDNSRIEAHL
ncbi:hypothetical protein EC973_004384 [Apophysomyces ossiformis]|uniref:Uncharacterized protein n=1 Tax=Apophysomyces ossiformis TaxID=679940 RepID=A0A8H7BSC8_9FUNG|nr:hypothetical protein EC973_004384 [Apophysomyces ossiformis]